MIATLERAGIDIAQVISRLRAQWEFDRDAARAACEGRGLVIREQIGRPPSDAELLADFWWYSGHLVALDEFCEQLEIDDGV